MGRHAGVSWTFGDGAHGKAPRQRRIGAAPVAPQYFSEARAKWPATSNSLPSPTVFKAELASVHYREARETCSPAS